MISQNCMFASYFLSLSAACHAQQAASITRM